MNVYPSPSTVLDCILDVLFCCACVYKQKQKLKSQIHQLITESRVRSFYSFLRRPCWLTTTEVYINVERIKSKPEGEPNFASEIRAVCRRLWMKRPSLAIFCNVNMCSSTSLLVQLKHLHEITFHKKANKNFYDEMKCIVVTGCVLSSIIGPLGGGFNFPGVEKDIRICM